MSKFTKENENKFKEVFYLIDQDKDDMITISEVPLALRALGIYLQQSDIPEIIREADENGNGKVSFSKMQEIYIEKLNDNKNVSDLVDAFRAFDYEESGYIDMDELIHGLKILGEPLTDSEIEMFMEEANIGKEGKVDYVKLSEMIFNEKYNE